jgi:YggT family protein
VRAIATLVYWAAWLLQILVLVRVLATWIPSWNYSSWMRSVKSIVDPLLRPFRKATASVGTTGVDFSPLIVIIILQLVQRFAWRAM